VAYLNVLDEPELSGTILLELHQAQAGAAAGVDPSWDEPFLATRRLNAAQLALLAYIEHTGAQIKEQVKGGLASKLGLGADDIRLYVLATRHDGWERFWSPPGPSQRARRT
jgi:hypothetical protein